MVKTKGSIDLKQRKTRKDKGKKRKFYMGKKIKRRRRKLGSYYVPYISRRKKSDPLRVWFFEIKVMDHESYLRWPKQFRQKLYKFVFYPIDKPFFISPSEIDTAEKIGELACERIQYPGTFHLRLPSSSKSSFRVSYRTKAKITIRDGPDEGLYAKVTEFAPMRRYWFFKK